VQRVGDRKCLDRGNPGATKGDDEINALHHVDLDLSAKSLPTSGHARNKPRQEIRELAWRNPERKRDRTRVESAENVVFVGVLFLYRVASSGQLVPKRVSY
jgi:hypothetical protein